MVVDSKKGRKQKQNFQLVFGPIDSKAYGRIRDIVLKLDEWRGKYDLELKEVVVSKEDVDEEKVSLDEYGGGSGRRHTEPTVKLKRDDSQEFFDSSISSVDGEWKRLDKEAEKIAEQVYQSNRNLCLGFSRRKKSHGSSDLGYSFLVRRVTIGNLVEIQGLALKLAVISTLTSGLRRKYRTSNIQTDTAFSPAPKIDVTITIIFQ